MKRSQWQSLRAQLVRAAQQDLVNFGFREGTPVPKFQIAQSLYVTEFGLKKSTRLNNLLKWYLHLHLARRSAGKSTMELDELKQSVKRLSAVVDQFPIGAVSLDDFKPVEEKIRETRESLMHLNARSLMLRAKYKRTFVDVAERTSVLPAVLIQ